MTALAPIRVYEVAPTEHLVANRYPDETHQALCGHLIIYLKA